MTQPPSDLNIRIDLSRRDLTDEEILIVTGILEEDMPGYTLVLADRSTDCQLDVPGEDFSPPLSDLQTHFGPLVEYEETVIEPPLPPQPVYDEESDLRLYLVRHDLWGDEERAIPVVISFRDRQVVAFG